MAKFGLSRVSAVACAVLAAAAIGLAVSNSAHAVDQPDNAAKNAKRVPPKNLPKLAPKNAAKNAAGTDSKTAGSVNPKNAARSLNPKVDPKTLGKLDPKNAARLDPKNTALGKNNPALNNQLRNGPGLQQNQALHGNLNRAAFDPRRLAERQRFFVDHRRVLLATQMRLPQRIMIGQPGFTGVPPREERRYVATEMMFHVGDHVSRAQVEAVARRHNMSVVGAHANELTGGTIYICRADRGQQVADAVRAMEAENLGVAQPNYVFVLTQDTPRENAAPDDANEQDEAKLQQDLAARTTGGDPSQYVVSKLKLGDVHRVATGSNVLVAVIDSKIDVNHPDLAGTIVEEFDAVGRPDQPDAHGTGMVGAIVAQRKLMGVAPGSRILAIHAFSTDGKDGAQATTRHILAGIDYAIKKGARVINMSFAGPYDPMLQLAMKKARDKGVVLVAAAGNAGPKSPPLYPAADPNVIGVTATDENDQLFSGANQGPQVAVAAPGVNILEPAPNGGYQVTTGTSVAAAHVSGVAALLIEKNPSLKPDAVLELLTSSAKTLGPKGRDDQFGWGLIDPEKALLAVDERIAIDGMTPVAQQPAKPAAQQAAKPPAKPSTLRPGPGIASSSR
jgi:subtilisin family serine protease